MQQTEKSPRKPKVQKPVARKKPGWLQFLDEVNVEMKKVTWPSRKEVIGSTGALIVATLIIGLFLGFVDFVLAKGVQPAMTGHADIWSYSTLVIFSGILFWIYKSN
ncbi:MAG: preprotein translocase subunit SecE [bacterium]